MIKSMTGFASLTRDDERGTIGVTIRAVNHRFLDLQLRLPTPLAALEPPLRALVQKRLGRGRVEIGRHDELVARPGGVYAGLHQMQLLETRPDTKELPADGPSTGVRASRRLKAESTL